MNQKTNHGFIFGSMDISRTFKETNGAATITIATPKTSFSIRATKTGQVRFYDDRGNECELVNKEYVNQMHGRVIKPDDSLKVKS